MIDRVRGANVLLTGASGGLGVHMAKALASAGANVFLTACPGVGLPELARETGGCGVKTASMVADLRSPSDRSRLVEWAEEVAGGVDILINNAGIEQTAFFHELSPSKIRDILAVNLEGPMMLTHEVLGGMVKRGRGHIVNISSLAGRASPACQEPYAATKAALVAFTYALRASYRDAGVSASVVCPGFVEAGIYSRLKATSGKSAPPLLAACKPEKVAKAVLRVIKRDRAESIVSTLPVRPLLVLSAMFPTVGEWVSNQLGAHEFFKSVAGLERSRAS